MSPPPPPPPPRSMSKRAMIIPILALSAAAGLFLTINSCWTEWEGGGAEQKTDDAYVRADLTPKHPHLRYRPQDGSRRLSASRTRSISGPLDDDDYGAMLAEAKAGLAAAPAARKQPGRETDSGRPNSEREVWRGRGHSRNHCCESGIEAVQPDVERNEPNANVNRRCWRPRPPPIRTWKAVATGVGFTGTLAAGRPKVACTSATRQQPVAVEAAKRERAALDTNDALYKAQIQAKEAAIIVSAFNLGYTASSRRRKGPWASVMYRRASS